MGKTANANLRGFVTELVKTGLPPVAQADARLFILGSLPGDASLSAAQYYAHPQNQFWKLVGSIVGEDLQMLPYSRRLERLAEHRIGLWDVIGSAVRKGSLDQAIRLPNHNRIEALIHDFPALETIAFNGATSAAVGRRLIGSATGINLVDLPSSSPANTRPFAEKAAAWAVLKPLVLPGNRVEIGLDD